MRAPKVVSLPVALTAALLSACAPRPGTEAAVPPAPPSGWDGLDRSGKLEFMQKTFWPEVKALFVRFDAHRYQNLGCTPCHARREDPDDFRMPNPDLLLPLFGCHAADAGGPVSESAFDDALDNFMREELTPATARLLGRPIVGPDAPQGVGCYTCHTVDP